MFADLFGCTSGTDHVGRGAGHTVQAGARARGGSDYRPPDILRDAQHFLECGQVLGVVVRDVGESRVAQLRGQGRRGVVQLLELARPNVLIDGVEVALDGVVRQAGLLAQFDNLRRALRIALQRLAHGKPQAGLVVLAEYFGVAELGWGGSFGNRGLFAEDFRVV